jgi:hypothetical protein
LELVVNLLLLLKGAVAQGHLDSANAKIARRTDNLKAELDRLASFEDRPTAGLEARANRLIIDLSEGATNSDAAAIGTALWGLRGVLQAADRMVNFPVLRLARLVEELGNVFVNEPAYDDLFEAVVHLLERRASEGAAGKSLLERGIQKLNGGKRYDAIRLFGRAQQRLALEEYRAAHITATKGCAYAYESAGLLWAARANMLVAASQALHAFWDDGTITLKALRCLQKLVWLELQLGRIPAVLAFIQLATAVAGALKLEGGQKEEFLRERRMQEAVLGILFLQAELPQLATLSFLPVVLDELQLPHAYLALMYALGYEEELRSDGWIPNEETVETVRAFFDTWLDQPAREDLPSKPILSAEPTTTLHSVVLGCQVVAECATNALSLQVGETILGAIEAILATSLDTPIVPHRSHFSIIIRAAESSDNDGVKVELGEHDGSSSLIVTHPEAGKLANQDEHKDWLVEALARCLVSIAVVDEPEAYFKKVGEEERAFGRVIDWLTLNNSISNILGNKQKQLLADWRQIGIGQDFPLHRAERWNSDLSGGTPAPTTHKPGGPRFGHVDPSNHFFDIEKLKHQDRRVYSIIDLPTWDRANWGATLYIYGNCSPPLGQNPKTPSCPLIR